MLYLGCIMSYFPLSCLMKCYVSYMWILCKGEKEGMVSLLLVTLMWCLSMDGGMGRYPYIAEGIA